jgi:dimethylamine corrinoid protein
MRDNVKIIIGGAPVSAEYCVEVGADDWAIPPSKTVNVCRGWAAAK